METIPNSREIVTLAGNKPALVILSAVPPRLARQQEAAAAVGTFGMPVCPLMLGNRAAFGDSAALGRSVQEYEPGGKAAAEINSVYKYMYTSNTI